MVVQLSRFNTGQYHCRLTCKETMIIGNLVCNEHGLSAALKILLGLAGINFGSCLGGVQIPQFQGFRDDIFLRIKNNNNNICVINFSPWSLLHSNCIMYNSTLRTSLFVEKGKHMWSSCKMIVIRCCTPLT